MLSEQREICQNLVNSYMESLTEKNFFVFAMRNYDNPGCQSLEEFKEDLNRIKYIKRLLNRYLKKNDLKERLLLNHIIVFLNVFGSDNALKMLFFKVDASMYPALKTFLVFLNVMPDVVHGVGATPIHSSDICIDMNIANILRNI
jgi:hypothetical protein